MGKKGNNSLPFWFERYSWRTQDILGSRQKDEFLMQFEKRPRAQSHSWLTASWSPSEFTICSKMPVKTDRQHKVHNMKNSKIEVWTHIMTV